MNYNKIKSFSFYLDLVFISFLVGSIGCAQGPQRQLSSTGRTGNFQPSFVLLPISHFYFPFHYSHLYLENKLCLSCARFRLKFACLPIIAIKYNLLISNYLSFIEVVFHGGHLPSFKYFQNFQNFILIYY